MRFPRLPSRSPSPPPSRRRFLGGAAALIPLPFFPSLEARAARRKPVQAPPRLIVYHVPNGFFRKSYTPTGEGRHFKLSPTLEPLESLRDEILIPRGVANTVAVPLPAGGAHAVGCGALLTCRFPDKGGLRAGVSLDQFVAGVLGKDTRLPSLQLGMDSAPGVDEAGWAAAYQKHISWQSENRPLPNVVSPKIAFDRIFQGLDPSANEADVVRRRDQRTSVLDTVARSASTLSATLNPDDRQGLDEYLTSMRDLESRIARTSTKLHGCPQLKQALLDESAPLADRLTQFHDLILLCLRCDITRVITFQMGNGLSGTSYPHLGFPDNGHAITHHGGDHEKIDKVKIIDRWRVEQLAKFLRLLKDTRDADGKTLLYNSVVLYMSEIGDGNRHDQMDKPMVIAGQLRGRLKTGRVLYTKPPQDDNTYAACDEYTRTLKSPFPQNCIEAPQLGQLYLTLLGHLGAPAESFGETGTAPLDLG